MTEPLPLLIETSKLMVRRGERRRLLLANKAIDQYRRFINHDAALAREGRLHG